MRLVIVGLGAALLMEPLAALLHRRMMHGFGWSWHRSHHQPRAGTWERNDRFPVVFAALTIAVMAVGAGLGQRALLAAGAGVTAYGLAYLLVHDLGIHGRFVGRPVGGGRYLRWVRSAHAVHHRSGEAPYGFLSPMVPPALRRPAAMGAGGAHDRQRQRAVATAASFEAVDTEARREKTS